MLRLVQSGFLWLGVSCSSGNGSGGLIADSRCIGVGVMTTMIWKRGRPLELRSTWLLIIPEQLGWAYFLWAWGEAFGSDFGSVMKWVILIVWALREGVLPPSSIT